MALQDSSDGLPEFAPVLIVGGGPIGLLQALLLSQFGVQSVIIERYPQRLAAPKAHAINPRSLEILRQYGLGEKRVRQLGTSRADGSWVNFITSLSGDAVGRLPYERMDPAVLDDTPEMIHNIPQPVLEQELTSRIAEDPNITLHKGFSIHAVDQTDNQVLATVEERSTGRLLSIRSRYLVACDGRRSKVRELLGISSEGEDSEQTMMTIHFNANLRPVVGDRVGMLFWIMDPIAAGFIIGYDLDGTQVHISQVDVTQQPIESWSDEMCRTKIRDAIGKDIPFDILSVRPWVFRRQIAETFQKGNVFLAGDAAHSFPPTGGLGLNCGMADAHNLAYKLALVHRGVARPSLLSTYTTERRSVADVYSRQSVKNGQQIFALLQSLKMAGVDDVAQARHNMMATLADPEQRAKVDEGIEGQREHFDNLELHIGYVYGASEPPSHASHYSPKFVSGARLPHAWISFSFPDQSSTSTEAARSSLPAEPVDVSYVTELSKAQVRDCQWSTLDLCGLDAFTLILGDNDTPLVAQIAQVQKQCAATNIRFNVWRFGKDFEVVKQTWFTAELNKSGGILVRPDQHILAMLTESTTADEVITALRDHLGQ
ncbi:Monooxygenase FAD-binding [Penicillium alfredii]|uniref:Monooxygenase FAD-binding n=1 Tax=Penicillium alfredii TaxID=1506179 RepID=A0A9W9ERK3_9EURO|nr:Monooxygenase FAD-binding [Penicillium alfredii]KAJ5086585.1 Monooxygenase FAD-binding [Penicillium alfredii]